MPTEEKQYIGIKNPKNETKCDTRGMNIIFKILVSDLYSN